MEDYPKVLNRLQNQCAKREYCSSDIYKKAYSAFDGDRELALKLVESLVADKFVDDLRYASAFAREKSSLSGWGKVKIGYMLSAKGISRETVAKAMEEIDAEAAGSRMESVILAKFRLIADDPQAKIKLLKFALSRGYQYDDVKSYVEELFRKNSEK